MWLLMDISDDVYINMVVKNEYTDKDVIAVHNALMGAVHIFGEKGKRFKGIVVEYPPEDLCTYHEYKGKPYFSIMFEEWGETAVGYGTYKPEVLSRYLIRHFMMPTVIKAAEEGRAGITVGEFLGAISDCRKSERQKVIAEVLEILSRYRLRNYDGKTHKSVGAEIKAEMEALAIKHLSTCSSCKFYYGVPHVQGVAACTKKKEMTWWNDRCDQFQTVKEGDRNED